MCSSDLRFLDRVAEWLETGTGDPARADLLRLDLARVGRRTAAILLEAEAEARRLLAEALKLYNDAGLSIEALKVLPEIAAAISEPLSRAGTTTMISNGNGHEGTGAAKLSQDVVQVLSQLSPIMEQLAGVDLKRFLQDVSKIPAAVTEQIVRIEPPPPRTTPS